MKNFVILTLLIGLPLTSLSLPSEAKGRNKDKIFEKLDLSKEQKVKVKEIRQAKRDKMKPLKDKMKAARDKMKKVFESDASDAELTKAHNEFVALRHERGNHRFESMLKIRALLSPAQRKKFHELKHGKHGRKKMWHGDDD